ncbi:hypothetical protein [Streptosporangium sp. NPDC006007]|uniref:hypothetical protein n=1 Tax=Streptosporangium sp. NPDC006007 TaxID=3154575 RepID=UPI0033A83DC9
MRLNRREALAALSGLALAGVTGCAGPPLRIGVVWSGRELSSFRNVVRSHPNVAVYSAGDDIATLLKSSAAPDVAIVPQPWLVHDSGIRARLEDISSDDPAYWQDLLRVKPGNSTGQPADPSIKGVWFKVTHKSLVWHRTGTPAPPQDWDTWLTDLRLRAERTKREGKGKGPLSIGAADGWTLTDWFENVLLGVDEAAYRGLLHDPAGWGHDTVRLALDRLADLWSIDGLLPGGGARALTTQFHESILNVFRYGSADMLAAPDFARSVIGQYCPGAQTEVSRLPWSSESIPPMVVGGDVLVALRSNEGRGREFVERLNRETKTPGHPANTAMKAWAGKGGMLSLDQEINDSSPINGYLTSYLRDGRKAAFDLSDGLLPGRAGGDGKDLWRVMTRLFVDVAVDGVQGSQAVSTAWDSLRALSRRKGRP